MQNCPRNKGWNLVGSKRLRCWVESQTFWSGLQCWGVLHWLRAAAWQIWAWMRWLQAVSMWECMTFRKVEEGKE